ncbi:HEAT repeat domain-containing protein [Streptomyces sp. NBC_00654]|uniref:HEAT repeat domain-containing protein n=1 Tax=Streptomyces sp. NBC_00654 TaxID=2975799 RepID=UPI00224E0D6E|nr:HEAT repeat domain-containing protein [Streptomyces sp. NBC_00654]MCX4967868.1 HEAT repeat domain-containing protein [Streptomyces sp. NBC_00654]
MTTPPDEQILDALRRADAARLARLLEAGGRGPDVLGRLVRHDNARVRYLGLTLLAERVAASPPGAGDPGAVERDGLVALLPRVLSGSPEEALVLAGLCAHLGPRLPRDRRPDWRSAGLPVRARVAWLRAELLTDPAVIRDGTPGELLYQAVRAGDLMAAHRPAHLVAELVSSRNPVLQAEALRLARQGLHTGLLAPATVRARLVPLLDAADAGVAVGALNELAEPWAAMLPLERSLLAPFLTADAATGRPEAAAAALTTAARHGHGGLLRQVTEDPDLPPVLRGRALELLGASAEREDISGLLEVAAQDPLLLAGPVLTCLRGLHRRGHFPAERDVRPLVGLALTDHSIPARAVATVLYTCRRAMYEALADAPDGDPDWPRRLDLLVALAGQGAPELPIGETITGRLQAAPAPGPFLDAIRTLRHAGAEEAVIALLPTAPLAALGVLEAIGGSRTVRVLAEGLGLPPAGGGDGDEVTVTSGEAGTIVPSLRGVRNRALEILWHLSREPEERERILVRLDPTDLPGRIAADLGGPDEAELALLRSRPAPDDPVAALCRLADHGGAGTGTLPVIADLLLRIVRDLASPPAEGSGPSGRDAARPPGEPEVPQEVLDAVHALGCRLHRRQRIRPVCLLDAVDERAAGHCLVATMALELLDRPALSGAEQAVLLRSLLRVPDVVNVRPRVHPLLRSRDPDVRKHVIALLARDAHGDDAQALSATLTVLTRSGDIRTVRQALLALGHARARWAVVPVAACLDHPNMNIKKTAASVLVRAGGPAAVPRLLHWLGRHDNPGLRTALVEALRTILGDAYAATLLAAAEQCEDRRARGLLLAGLDGVLTGRAVLALDAQVSAVVPALLGLVSSGGVRLASGSAGELAEPMSRHGVTPPAARTPGAPAARASGPGDGADSEVAVLLTGGWNASAALRIAARPEPPDAHRLAELRKLRPLLEDWLGLTARARSADARLRLLRCVLRLCPGPWTSGEVAAFARFGGVLITVLDEVAGGRPGTGTAAEEFAGELMAPLAAVAPRLSDVERFAVVESVRALPVGAGGGTAVLGLLRQCGAVLVRADLDRALAAAHLGADPWRAGPAVLREAFGVPERAAAPAGRAASDDRAESGELSAWQAALSAAVRTPRAFEEFRRTALPAPDSRDRLDALIVAHPDADPTVRDRLVDWMQLLQPLDAPAWTIAETSETSGSAGTVGAAAGPAAATPPAAARTVHSDDLDQPRSAALRDRLLTMLDAPDPDRRNAAAKALRAWPEPGTARAVLRAFLRGRVDEETGGARLARTFATVGEAELRGDGVRPDRVLRMAGWLDPWDLPPLVPLVVEWWESGPPGLRAEAGNVLSRVPGDVLAQLLGARVDAGSPGILELLSGQPLLRTPALVRARRHLRTEGRDALADRLLLVEGPLRGPEAAGQDAAALEALRSAAPVATEGAGAAPALRDLLDRARGGTPEEIRRALTLLAERYGRRPVGQGRPVPYDDREQELSGLIDDLLRHPKAGVRLHAHRTSRALLDRSTHARQTMFLLDDPQPDVVRMAIRTLAHAGWEPAIPALTGLLGHAQPTVRGAAVEAIGRFGAAAVPALRRAAAHARPDRRSRYTDVLAQLMSADDA